MSSQLHHLFNFISELKLKLAIKLSQSYN